MNDLNEALLGAWMEVSSVINNERVSARIPYNVASILRYLTRSDATDVTASELCAELRMQKSQMNRTLQYMEDHGMITRERAESDKRCVYIRLHEERLDDFLSQHDAVIRYIGGVTDALGEAKTRQLIDLIGEVIDIIKEKDPHLQYINDTIQEDHQ
ncbi:MAG: helix-turn-helix domain-containing protein [Peptococcaceae bacterium]|nr:helix-turn-helix domain-containing protein [Peptococcaceae bacterium]